MRRIRPVIVAVLALGVWCEPAAAQYSTGDIYNPSRDHSSEILLNLRMLSNEQRVDTAMSLLLGNSDSGPPIAVEILLQQEAQYVVDPIIEAITYEWALEDDTRRRYAYIVLSAKQDWRHPRTYELLTLGLIDWRVNDVCKDALMVAPLERRPEAVPILASHLGMWYVEHPRATSELLTILGSYGPDSRRALDEIQMVYESPSELWPENRIHAAIAIAQIGGLPGVLELYSDRDTLQYRAALAGLEYLGSLEPSPYGYDQVQTQAALNLLHGGFVSASDSVVWAALRAAPVVYGETMYDSGALNPRLKNALITGAQEQKRPELRSTLVAVLRQFEADAARQ